MLPVISVATECPPLYELRNDTYKSCYMFVGDYLTWYEAELYCKTTGGHLVALETSDEQEFLIDYVQKSNSEYLQIACLVSIEQIQVKSIYLRTIDWDLLIRITTL